MISLSQKDIQTIKMALSGWVNFGTKEVAQRKAQLSAMGPMSERLSAALTENVVALESRLEMGADLLRRLSDDGRE